MNIPMHTLFFCINNIDGLFINLHSTRLINTHSRKKNEHTPNLIPYNHHPYSRPKILLAMAMSTSLILGVICLLCMSGTSALVCKIGQKACGDKCYFPIGRQCLEGQVCSIGQSVCGNQCFYDAGLQTCLDGHLCKIGQKLCKSQCYYPVAQTCISRRWLIGA